MRMYPVGPCFEIGLSCVRSLDLDKAHAAAQKIDSAVRSSFRSESCLR
jgi:hypothetical protein